MTLLGEPLDRKRTVLTVLLGLAGFTGVFFPFSIAYPPYTISVTWSLFLPMLAVLAYGRRSAFVVVAFCGMGFFSFFLWPTNGWANLVNMVIYGSWYLVHGHAADLRRTRPSVWNNPYSVQLLCSAVYTVLLVTVFPRLFMLNPPFWFTAAPASIPPAVVQSTAVTQAFFMFGALFLCDLLLNVPAVLRRLGVPAPASARFMLRTIFASIAFGLVLMIAVQVLEAVLMQRNLTTSIEHGSDAEHGRMVFLSTLLSMVAGFQLAKYTGRRHESEEALRVNQERFNAIFNSINDAIFLYDPGSGAILDVNRHMSELFGYSREEARMLSVGDVSSGEPPYTVTDALAWLQRPADGRPQVFEWRFRHKDGRLFWGEVSMRRAVIGGADRMLMVVRDVTRRKKVETELHEIERRYRMLFDSSGDAVFLMEGERIVDCNNKALEVFGCSWEHLLGAAPARFFPAVQPDGKDSRALFLEKITAAGAGEHQFFEWQHCKLDGTPFEAEVSLNRIELSSGMHIQSIVRDISERKKAEQEREKLITKIQDVLGAVSRSQKEWQDTFDSITDLISIHDRDFNIVRVNKAFAEHVGLPYQQVIGRKCYELLHGGAGGPAPYCPHLRTLTDGKPATDELVDAASGRTLRISTYPYHAPDGSLIGSIHIARDITAEKERELRMIMTERLSSLGQMASGIAHEINNPLESVMICAEMLLLRVEQDNYDHAQFEKYLKIIDEEVMRCRDITGSMLALARGTAGGNQDVDVQPILEKVIDLVAFQGRLRQVEVRKEYAANALVRGNEGELRQVFLIIVLNALDAMENNGALTIGVDVRNQHALIRISDTGPGIPAGEQQKIFQPFYTTKSDKDGTGLGLSIAHRIIANHQGFLEVSSEPGHGATFTVTLPLSR